MVEGENDEAMRGRRKTNVPSLRLTNFSNPRELWN